MHSAFNPCRYVSEYSFPCDISPSLNCAIRKSFACANACPTMTSEKPEGSIGVRVIFKFFGAGRSPGAVAGALVEVAVDIVAGEVVEATAEGFEVACVVAAFDVPA